MSRRSAPSSRIVLGRMAGTASPRVIGILLALLLTVTPSSAISAPDTASMHGLQGGWAIDNDGRVDFPGAVIHQLAAMRAAGATWVRINFRLGTCHIDWVLHGCN